MELLIFLSIILVFIMLFHLRSRVQYLEQRFKEQTSRNTVENYDDVHSNQAVVSQTTISNALLHYISEELRQGRKKQDIKPLLLAKGWKESEVEPAFEVAMNQMSDTVAVSLDHESIQSSVVEKFILWLQEDWLLKIGALLLLISFGWLTTYAFLNNWIGPMGRIALGIIVGVCILLFGWQRIKTYLHQGSIFLVLGSTTILLTIFAAREVYDFFTPLSALVVMFLSTAFVALASVKYNNRALALGSLILASIAPLLTNTPADTYTGLFAYLFVVLLGAIWIVVLTGTRELTTAALIVISLYSLPHLVSITSADKGILLLFAYAFAAILFLTNTVGMLKMKQKEIIPDLVTAAGNGLFLLTWIMAAAQDEWKSLIITAWMVVFVVGAFLVFKITHRQEPFYAYTGIGIAMLAAATAVELQGAALTIAYTIESAAIVLIAFIILRDIKITQRLNMLFVVPIILSLSSINSSAWLSGVIHKDFFVLLFLSFVLMGLGLFFMQHVQEVEDEEAGQFNALLLIFGSGYVYILLWLSLHAGFMNDNIAVMISLLVYTIIGLVCYFYGIGREKRGLYIYGGVVVGFVVGRLLLIDVWRMELAGRILTFFLIGALLMSTAFLGAKEQKKEKTH